MNHLFDKMPPHVVAEIKAKMSQSSQKSFALESWMEGYAEAVRDFSVWKDGKQTIGVMQLDPKQVIADKRRDVLEILE